MSGWKRLWIVLSILLGLVSGAMAFGQVNAIDHEFAYQLNGIKFDPAAFKARAEMEPALRNCEWSTAKATAGSGMSGSRQLFRVRCNDWRRYWITVLFSFLPALILSTIGLTVRWIWRGFKPNG